LGGIGIVGAAIGNVFYNATDKRVRDSLITIGK
jgi:CO/xanthine dehydrogenase Mo-binding subunit